MIQDHSDHGASKEPTNPSEEWIDRFLWCAMIRVIFDHRSRSGSSQRNAPLDAFISFLEVSFFQNCQESKPPDPSRWLAPTVLPQCGPQMNKIIAPRRSLGLHPVVYWECIWDLSQPKHFQKLDKYWSKIFSKFEGVWLKIERVDKYFALLKARKPSFDAYIVAEKPSLAFPGS